jgi:TRAP-type C4-dicarboxylate transport system permease small subunit
MTYLKTFDRMLTRLELAIAIAAMSGVVIILIAQVFFRYILQNPLFFAEELALLLLIVATFSGLSLMVAEDRLIAIDMLGARISERKRRWIIWTMRVIVLLLAIALTNFSILYLSVPWVWSETSATLGIPRAYLYAIVTAELCFLVVHQFVELIVTWPHRASQSKELTP